MWLMVLVGIILITSSIYASTWSDDKSLNFYFKFNELSGTTANDIGKMNKDLAGLNGTFVAGKLNNAYKVNNESSSLQIKPWELFNVSNFTTITFWINITGTIGVNNVIVGDAGTNADGFWGIGTGSGDKLIYSCGGGDGAAGSDPLTFGTWYHVIAEWNRTGNNRKIFINNVSYNSQACAKNITWTGNPIMLFGNASSKYNVYNMSVDDLRIYNRSLTDSEKADIYNNGIGAEASDVTFNNVTYNASTYEGNREMYIVNLSYNNAIYTSISTNLFWNNVSYGATQSGSGSTLVFIRNVDIPQNKGNVSLKWSVNLYTGATLVQVNSSTYYQNTLPINLTLCDYGSYMNITFVNFTAKDEETSAKINLFTFEGTFNYWTGGGEIYKNYSYSNSSGIANGAFCGNPPYITLKTRSSITFGDNNSVYVSRSYNLPETSLSNVTSNITLYLLKSASSTTFIQKVVDVAQTAQPNVYIYTDRFYSGTNTYETVQITKTGDDGKTIGFYKTETVTYRHRLYDEDGNLLLQTSPAVVFAESAPYTITFTIGSDYEVPWNDLEELGNLWSAIAFSNNTRLANYTYIDTSTSFEKARFYVEKVYWNQSNKMICNTTSAVSSAVLSCDLSSYNGSMIAHGYITRNSTEYLVQVLAFDATPTTSPEIFEKGGLFLAWFILLVAGMVFLYNFIAGMWIEVAAIFFVNLMGIAKFPAIYMWGAAALAIIVTVVMNKYNGGGYG